MMLPYLPKIDIILATHNGERYIAEFFDSIIKQSYQNWSLLVSDDLSKDRTRQIVSYYCQKDNRIKLVSTAQQGGVIKNFAKCISYSSSNYLMFADQDDVWLPDKITLSLKTILKEEEQRGSSCPILVFTDLKLVDEYLNIISDSFYRFNRLNPVHNTHIQYLTWKSTVFGCSTIFNSSLKNKVGNIDDRVMMHDHIFALIACLFGKVVYLNEATILYRQHSNNQVGGLRKNFIHKLINLSYYIKSLHRYRKKFFTQIDFINERFKQESSSLNFSLLTLNDRWIYIKNNLLPYVSENPAFTIALSILILLK